jgi:hypothetical protein
VFITADTSREPPFKAAAHLDRARDDILAFTAFPREALAAILSNNPQDG